MNFLLTHFKKLDWILIISAVFLAVIGLLTLYSSSLGRSDFSNFKKQIVFLGIGFFLMLLFSFFDFRGLKNSPYLILSFYFLCLILLAGLLLFAPEIRGARGWYKIGPVSLDPIELTKIILIILLAKYFSMRHVEMYKMRHIFLSGFYVLVPTVLIFLQPDLGSAMILIALWLAVLIISGIKLRHFVFLCLLGALIFSIGWFSFLEPYQKERIVSFIVPEVEPLGIGWSQQQSKIAIGSGGIFGKGLGKGSQTQYGFLSEPQTDFVFAAIAEEFGLLGVSILFFSFIIFIWRIIKIAVVASSNFFRLFASGFAIVLISQIFINIGMNIGILPIIGISLPLISYGGSSLIATFIGIGMAQSIRTN